MFQYNILIILFKGFAGKTFYALWFVSNVDEHEEKNTIEKNALQTKALGCNC